MNLESELTDIIVVLYLYRHSYVAHTDIITRLAKQGRVGRVAVQHREINVEQAARIIREPTERRMM